MCNYEYEESFFVKFHFSTLLFPDFFLLSIIQTWITAKWRKMDTNRNVLGLNLILINCGLIVDEVESLETVFLTFFSPFFCSSIVFFALEVRSGSFMLLDCGFIIKRSEQFVPVSSKHLSGLTRFWKKDYNVQGSTFNFSNILCLYWTNFFTSSLKMRFSAGGGFSIWISKGRKPPSLLSTEICLCSRR